MSASFSQMVISLFPGLVSAGALYIIYRAAEPFLAMRRHLKEAHAVGLPVKVLPVPQGQFSFFAFQVASKLRLARPGSWLHRILNAGRPEGHEAHEDLGDTYLTVNPFGVGLVVADPAVASHVYARREQFPKPPNTGALINLYGRNVISSRGEDWRFHRRVTGPIFSERIHEDVWNESARQADLMRSSWNSSSVADLAQDARRLALNVLTAVAYGCPLDWTSSLPTATPNTQGEKEDFAELVTGLNAHLMSLFLLPKWWLRLAPVHTAAGQARAAYIAFEGYLRGMLAAERERMENGISSENLLTALLEAESQGDKDQRHMTEEEVLGNAFVFIFAGHETTANTLHYALLLLAANPEMQTAVLSEIDALYAAAAEEGRELGYEDFGRARWIMAVMHETLRVYTPTSMINKWTQAPTPIPVAGRTYMLPANTRISISNIGVHRNPAVWGENADDWNPARWILPAAVSVSTTIVPFTPAVMLERSMAIISTTGLAAITPPPTPQRNSRTLLLPESPKSSDALSRSVSTSSLSTLVDSRAPSPKLLSPDTYLCAPSPTMVDSACTPISEPRPWEALDLLKPPKGSFLPFSEGQRACTARKFASVEFVSSLCAVLRDQRVALGDAWDAARLKAMLRGRKAGALTLQPPEVVPLVFETRL